MSAHTSSDQYAAQVESLLSQMTIEEKAGQLTQFFYFGGLPDPEPGSDNLFFPSQMRAFVEEKAKVGGVGSVLFVRDAQELNRLQKLTIEGHRLGIPLLVGYDVIHGFKTIFPVPLAVAASFEPAVAERGQSIAAKEARSIGIHWTFAPMVDIARDSRWGRIIESAGEDPFLGAAMAAAQVRGFQGRDLSAGDNVLAGPKHYAAYGAALGGRDYDEVDISDSELHNVYLPPFEAAAKAGAENFMTAYMGINGIPATAHKYLITDILRKEWGFKGFLVSDANAVINLITHHFAKDRPNAASAALNAGLDMEMAMFDSAFEGIPDAVANGEVSIEKIDEAVRRILTAKAKLGLFENPYVDVERSEKVLNDPAHRVAAREAAEKTFVLLKNDKNALPLDATALKSIAVIGPFAHNKRDILGPWCFAFDLNESVSIFDGIKAKVGNSVNVEYAQGVSHTHRIFPSIFDLDPNNIVNDPEGFNEEAEFAKAVALAQKSDVTILVLGEQQSQIGEQASRSSFELPGRQAELLKAIAATGTQVILLMQCARPLDLTWASENIPAIMAIWYPGTSGGHAVANTLFGENSPAGRLPFTWVRSVGQVPMIYSHHISHEPQNSDKRYWNEPSSPLYIFGHGLSYTNFSYSDLTLDKEVITKSDSLKVEVTVTNSGTRDSDEVVQLYIHQRYGTAIRPIRELKGFKRIHLKAGASEKVSFALTPRELRYWNAAVKGWVNDSTHFDLWVGRSSAADLHAEFEVK
jgi:beta-glucosidase